MEDRMIRAVCLLCNEAGMQLKDQETPYDDW